jgi:hypothetical protein
MPSHQGTNGDSTNRPSSAPPDINDTHRPALLSPFQPSASLPRHNRSIEPRSGGQEPMQWIQREPDITNEDLANKNEGLNELWELVDPLKGQVT